MLFSCTIKIKPYRGNISSLTALTETPVRYGGAAERGRRDDALKHKREEKGSKILAVIKVVVS